MAYEQKPGQFSLFKNDKTGGKETWPDYRGTGLDLDGNSISVSCWLKEGKSGKFMSCSISVKQEQTKESKKPSIDDDDIPF